MPSKHISRSRKKSHSRSRSKSSAQKRHQARAAKAMQMWKSGKARSLSDAWSKV